MVFIFPFLKSKDHENKNTEIFRKDISGQFVIPSRHKRKHNQKAHVEPRTLPITPLVQTCPRWESSQWGVCEFRTNTKKNAKESGA